MLNVSKIEQTENEKNRLPPINVEILKINFLDPPIYSKFEMLLHPSLHWVSKRPRMNRVIEL